jgi:hypothetical protein
METVMLVESVNDRITRRRHTHLESSSLLSDIKLTFCYAADISPEEEQGIGFGMLPSIEVSEAALFDRVDQAIKEVKPDYVIVHSGFVFRQNSDAFMRAFERLRSAHSQVGFGIQERHGLEFSRKTFHQTGRIKELHTLIFEAVLNGRG